MPRYDISSPRLFVPDDLADGRAIELSADHAHYLMNVLRLKEGALLLVFNGRDGEWRAEIVAAKKKHCLLEVRSKTRDQTLPCDLHYYFSPLKRARQDYVAQKATEMGASLLRPVLLSRTLAERVKLDRLYANAVEASEQCGILSVPLVQPPVRLADMLRGWDEGRHLILCDEDAPVADPLEALRAVPRGPLAVLVGPEGGFTDEERAALQARPYVKKISLGPRILRADTAAIAALALVQAVLGDTANA